MSWRSWSGEFIERGVVFHVKHCGVGRFAGWLFESVVSSLLVVGGWCFTWNSEAYSAAGKTWFGWWLVEHYFSYHVDCPDGCVSGEPAGGG